MDEWKCVLFKALMNYLKKKKKKKTEIKIKFSFLSLNNYII